MFNLSRSEVIFLISFFSSFIADIGQPFIAAQKWTWRLVCSQASTYNMYLCYMHAYVSCMLKFCINLLPGVIVRIIKFVHFSFMDILYFSSWGLWFSWFLCMMLIWEERQILFHLPLLDFCFAHWQVTQLTDNIQLILDSVRTSGAVEVEVCYLTFSIAFPFPFPPLIPFFFGFFFFGGRGLWKE